MFATVDEKIVKRYLEDLRNIELDIKGTDLQDLGIQPSIKYQECFDYILKEKLKNPTLDKDMEIKLAQEFFA
jgi:hypothetical protein